MKIALVSQEFPPETARGGIGTQTFVKARGMAAEGHEVFVISRSRQNSRSEKKVGNVTVIRIPGMENIFPEMTESFQWLTHSINVAAELESLHREHKLDLVDFPEWAAEGYAFLLNRVGDMPKAVVQLHGPLIMFANEMDWPSKQTEFFRTGTYMEATCLRLADAVYSSSACSAGWVNKFYLDAPRDIPVIHLGIDTKIFSDKKVTKYDRPTIIFAGRLVYNKGVEELVKAVCDLSEYFPGIQLILAGTGETKFIDKLKELSSDKKDIIKFTGYLGPEELAGEFSRAHIFAAPSHYEGGPGFVYLEAMACGLPVIACSGSGVEEIVSEGKNGVLVPPKDIMALRSAIIGLLEDPIKASVMGERGKAFVRENAESEVCLQRLLGFYNNVLANQTRVNV